MPLRRDDWEYIVLITNVILSLFLLHMLRVTGIDAYAMGAMFTSAAAVFQAAQILRRLL